MQKINKDKFNTGVVFRVGVLTNQVPTGILQSNTHMFLFLY